MNLRKIDANLPEFDSSVKKVGLYGGSFNPPHMGHVFMTLITLMTQDLDEIWVIPCASHPVKDTLAPFRHRVQMCRRAFGRLSDVQVTTVENVLPKPSYTVQTIEAIQSARPDLDLHYIIGGDIVEDIPDWENAEGLSELARLIVVPRQGHPIVDPPPELGDYMEVDIGFDLPALSSSHLKKMLCRGAEIAGFVDQEVYNQIHRWSIYEPDSEAPEPSCEHENDVRFGSGDVVVCVDDSNTHKLRKGKKYRVDYISNHRPPMVYLVGPKGSWALRRFKKAPKQDREKVPFAIGDKVRCVDASGTSGRLSKGETYEVRLISCHAHPRVYMKGSALGWGFKRFEKVNQWLSSLSSQKPKLP